MSRFMATRICLNLLLIVSLLMTYGVSMDASAMDDFGMRVVVLPIYVENGVEVKSGGKKVEHYRRVIRYINNYLVRQNFEVVNPFAQDLKEIEYNKYMEKAREDSSLAAMDLCKRFATDAAFIITLNVRYRYTPDGLCRVSTYVEGEAYDSGGRSLGLGVDERFKKTALDCFDAIVDSEKEAASKIGQKFASLQDHGLSQQFVIRLEGASNYEEVETFGKVLNGVRGVKRAKMYRLKLAPNNPQASLAFWSVKTGGTDSFRLQANIIKNVKDIINSGGNIEKNGIKYRYSAGEIAMLKGLRPGDCSSRELHFVIDRELARDKEFSSGN